MNVFFRAVTSPLSVLLWAVAYAADTITDLAGTLTTQGYPNGFTQGSSWRFRASSATKYDLYFEDIDIDGNCDSYITVYDDQGIGLPVKLLCDSDSGHRMTVYTSKITVSVVRAYSGSPPGKRGVKMHYSVNDAEPTTISTTTTEVTTDENGNTPEPTEPPSTISTSTHSQGTNAQGYPTPPPMPGQDPSAFPLPDPSVDAACGNTFNEPIISNFDYKQQDKFVRGLVDEFNPDQTSNFVVNGEVAVPNSFPWQVTIGDRARSYCGGTIITDQFVVTAAHCGVLVFLGTYSSDMITGR